MAAPISLSTRRASRKAGSPRCAAPGVGHGVLCRRTQQCDDRRQSRHAAQAAEDHRLLDLLVDRPGRMRPIHRRPQSRCRRPLRYPNHRQGRVFDVASAISSSRRRGGCNPIVGSGLSAAVSAMEPRHLGVQIDAYELRQGGKVPSARAGAPTPFPALSLPVPCWHTRQGKFFPC